MYALRAGVAEGLYSMATYMESSGMLWYYSWCNGAGTSVRERESVYIYLHISTTCYIPDAIPGNLKNVAFTMFTDFF